MASCSRRAITREEIALIMQNYARATDHTLPVIREAITFADNGDISSVYSNAIRAMQQASVMVGSSGNEFNQRPGPLVPESRLCSTAHQAHHRPRHRPGLGAK